MALNKFRVLLYSDGTQQALSATVYAATLLQKIPNMYLTIVQIQECKDKSMGTRYNWLELRPKQKRFYRSSSVDSDFRWVDTWKNNPSLTWVERMEEKCDWKLKNQYYRIVNKINRIFLESTDNIEYKWLLSNISFQDSFDTSDTEDLLIDYASNNRFDLIIIGTRQLTKINQLIHGNLAANVQKKSPIPVTLVKKLSEEFINDFINDSFSFHEFEVSDYQTEYCLF